MTQFNKANKVWSWSKEYNFDLMEDRIQVVADCNLQTIKTLYSTLSGEGWSSGFLKEWKVYAEISSLAEAPFPNLSDSLSEDERLSAVLNVEWGSPRFHFCIWSTDKASPSNLPSAGDWQLEGKHSLINGFGYPYRIYYPIDLLTNNIAREFGEGFKFGFSLEDVGFGYPSSSEDSIVTSGNWTQEMILLSPDPQPVVIYIQQSTASGGGTSTVNPPTISGVPTNDVLLASSTPIVFAIGNLVSGANFTVELLRGTTVANTQTLQASSTTYNYSVTPSTYLASGTASYSVKVTQGNLAAQTNTFNMVQPSAVMSPLSISRTSSLNINVRVSNLISGQTYILQFVNNANNADVTTTYSYTYNPPSGQTYEDKPFSGQTFGQYFAGYSSATPAYYKIRIKSTTGTTYNFLGSEILTVTA